MTSIPSIHDERALEALRRRCGLEPEDVQRFRNRFLKAHHSLAEAMAGWPTAVTRQWLAGLREHELSLVTRQISAKDRAEKILLRTADGLLVESVLMRSAGGRPSLCLSSQVGCPMACRFCATGSLGLRRNLSAYEILDQVVWANRLAGHRHGVRNVMFMGMGEPLLNSEAVFAALERLISPRHFALSHRRIMLSTCGIPEIMLALARRFPGVSQALSLHSARQAIRERLMPVAKDCPLECLRETLEALTERLTSGRMMIEVLLLRGINDELEDARLLGEFLKGLPVYINLISYNTTALCGEFKPSPASQRTAFARVLEGYGFTVTQRYSLGADIGAACGQLAASVSSLECHHGA